MTKTRPTPNFFTRSRRQYWREHIREAGVWYSTRESRAELAPWLSDNRIHHALREMVADCLLYTSPSPRD